MAAAYFSQGASSYGEELLIQVSRIVAGKSLICLSRTAKQAVSMGLAERVRVIGTDTRQVCCVNEDFQLESAIKTMELIVKPTVSTGRKQVMQT